MKLYIALMLCAATAVGQTEKQPAHSVSVQGLGKISTVPDQVRLSVQVNTRAESASEAMTQTSKKTNDILAILKSLGVELKDIQTSRVSVTAILDYQKNIQPPPIIGYTGINDFTVIFKGKLMEKVGTFMDKSVAAGVSSFSGLTYESSGQRELEREALKKAADDARIRAEVLAKQLGATLGNVITVSEAVNTPSPVGIRSALMDASATAAPVMVGELAISAQISATFELK
jgi:uncharacterized protein YggE